MSEPVDTLGSYVPALILQQLADDPVPLAAPRADNFPAAVLFADIKGFTPLTEKLAQRGIAGAEELSRVLYNYFDVLITLITEHGGDVIKFAGDAVLTIWPADDGDLGSATRQAAQCALAIQSRLHNYPATDDVHLAMKIGLGAGRVSLLQIGGVFARWEAILIGTPIVQASRAEGNALPSQVIIDPECWGLAQDELKVELLTTAEGRQVLRLDSVREPLSLKATTFPRLQVTAETALRAYIPGAILKRLSAGQMEYLAELRRVTVLFVNLPGFEQITLREEAHELMRTIQSALYKYEGSVIQLLMDDKGTTLVAAFGLPPFAHADDAARGTLAALEIQSALRDMNLQFAIGITSGQAYCGERGNERRREYTVLGDIVNLSARLMQAALKNSSGSDGTETDNFAILCDEATYHAAQSRVSFTILPAIQVKGKTTPIAVYCPEREKKAAARLQTDIIGRATERATLTHALQSLQRGKLPGVIFIEGEAGIGKSRLVDDMRQQAREMNLNVVSGAGDAVERSSYYAWHNIFAELLGATDITDPDARLQQIEVSLDKDERERAPLLGTLWGQEWDNDLTKQLTGQVRADNTRELLLDILQKSARTTPLILILEDAHWLDSASWALLLAVSRHAHDLPILPVIAARPMPDPLPQEYVAISKLHHFTFLRLRPLSVNDATTLVCQRLGVTDVPEKLSAFIREKAEGNPFFSEELAYALRDSGALEISGAECRIATNVDLQSTTFPDTVQGILASRIDRLTPQQQLTLKVASVIGRMFAVSLLREIHPVETDKPKLRGYLDTLERLEFTPRAVQYSDEQYFFKHVITREVAYNLMLFSQRRALHRAIAEWYEHTFGDDLAPHYSTLAHHWRHALDDAQPDPRQVLKTLDYLEKAGEQAQRSGSYREAVEYFTQALALEGEQKKPNLVPVLRLARWERSLGEAYFGLGRNPEARHHVNQALTLLHQPASMTSIQVGAGLLVETLKQIWHRIPLIQKKQTTQLIGKNETTLEVVRSYNLQATLKVLTNETDASTVYTNLRVLNLAETAGESSPELAGAYGFMCVTAGIIPWHAQARRYGNLARQTAKNLDNLATLALTMGNVSIYYTGIGQWVQAKEGFEQATEIFERLGDRQNWTLYMATLCFLAGFQGNFVNWQEMTFVFYQVAHANEHVEHQAWALNGRAMTLMRLGQLEEAAKVMNTALPLLASLPESDLGGIFAQGTIAILCLHQGQFVRARQAADAASRLLSKTSIPYFTLLDSYAAVADVYLALWEIEKMQTRTNLEIRELAWQACKALHRFARTYPIGRPHAWLCQGLYDWLNGKHSKAQRAWHKSIAYADQLAMPYEEGLAHYELGRHSKGNERQTHLTHAIEIFERLGVMYDLEKARAAKGTS